MGHQICPDFTTVYIVRSNANLIIERRINIVRLSVSKHLRMSKEFLNGKERELPEEVQHRALHLGLRNIFLTNKVENV